MCSRTTRTSLDLALSPERKKGQKGQRNTVLKFVGLRNEETVLTPQTLYGAESLDSGGIVFMVCDLLLTT
jgi:hypothetical protein